MVNTAALAALVAPGVVAPGVFAVPPPYMQNGLVWSGNAIRMNQIQVIGTHNSYHIEAPLEEREVQQSVLPDTENFWYSEAALGLQLEKQHVRSLEFDVFADPEGGNYAEPLIRNLSGLDFGTGEEYQQPGTKVLHVPDVDIHTTCTTFIGCLKEVKEWLDDHPDSVPIPVLIEFSQSTELNEELGGATIIPWDNAELLDSFDEEIRSVFGKEQLITPDHIRRCGSSLEDSVLKYGWPDLESARGRIFFLMDNGPDDDIRTTYIEDRPNLEGRVLFTNASPGDPDCAFRKLNTPLSDEQIEEIQTAVSQNYWVRTRSDEPIETVLNCTTERRDQALRSGAQIVSTDFPAWGMSSRWDCDYAVRLEKGRAARCNPVNGPKGCKDGKLENQEYLRN